MTDCRDSENRAADLHHLTGEGVNRDIILEAHDRLQSVADVGQLLAEADASEWAYRDALRISCTQISASTALLFVYEASDEMLYLAASVGLGDCQRWLHRPLPLGRGLSGWVAEHRRPYFSNDLKLDGRFGTTSCLSYERMSSVSVPVLYRGELLGVLTFCNQRSNAFSKADMITVEALSSSIALGLRMGQIRKESNCHYLACIQGLINALEAKDPSTKGHSLRIAHFSREIGRSLSFSKDRRDRLEIAARLHDIGKIGLPEQILNKREPLTEEEWTLVRRHPAIGAEILHGIPALKDVSRLVEAHHERFDGRGYPHGLMGEDIPLESRIISVADTFDAMISIRPYRRQLTGEQALGEVCRSAGSQFDPRVVEAFKSIIRAKTTTHFYSDNRAN